MVVMLTEERQEEILKLLDQKRSVTVQELKTRLKASESTIRRDLNELHQRGKLIKVFGGAVAADSRVSAREEIVSDKENINREEKIRIARYAAGLIGENDFVYLDAGTTTAYLPEYITAKTASFVTNGITHAKALAQLGYRVILIGGELKASTEAIVGNEAYVNLQKFNFTIGFFGTNGISKTAGFTTPEINEAMTKQCAIRRTHKKYILGDHTKFGQITPVTYSDFHAATIITDDVLDETFGDAKNIIIVPPAI